MSDFTAPILLGCALIVAAVIYALAPHHRHLAALPFAAKLLGHAGFAFRDHRRGKATRARWRGTPAKPKHEPHKK